MLGCTDDVSAKYFSDRSGEMSIEVNSTMTLRKTIAFAQMIPHYRHTEGQGRRKLMTQDEVFRMSNKDLLCIIRGCNILKLNKLDYSKHPMYQLLQKTSIFDYYPTVNNKKLAIETVEENLNKQEIKQKLYSSVKPPDEF